MKKCVDMWMINLFLGVPVFVAFLWGTNCLPLKKLSFLMFSLPMSSAVHTRYLKNKNVIFLIIMSVL